MLGRLEMDIRSCIDAYLRLSKSVFRPKYSKFNVLGWAYATVTGRERFSSKALECAIKEVVRSIEGEENASLRREGEGCKS